MSPLLYLAAALIGATPADSFVNTRAAASPSAIHRQIEGTRDLQHAFGSSSHDWISTRQLTSNSASDDARSNSATHREPTIADAFSHEPHWAASTTPAFLTSQVGFNPASPFADLRSANRFLDAASGRVVRAQDGGQAPAYDEVPKVNSNLDQPILLPPTFAQPFTPPGGPMWGGDSGFGVPNGSPIGSQYGASGARPFRFGTQWKMDVGFMPKEQTDGGAGSFGHMSIFEFNSELRYTAPTQSQYVWSIAPQFNLRSYDSNPPAGTVSIPNEVYRFGADLQLTSPNYGGSSMEVGFTPSLNTDFQQNATSDAWNLDGRAALFYRSSPKYMLVLGAMFWDRVDDQIIPWVGWVYTPDDRWEFRAVFPSPEISCFIGTLWGAPQWWYLAGEYHVEAYQTESNLAGVGVDQMEIEDWRVVTGIRSETFGYSSFVEAGWVFGRNVKYARSLAPSEFDISSGFIARVGLRF